MKKENDNIVDLGYRGNPDHLTVMKTIQ